MYRIFFANIKQPDRKKNCSHFGNKKLFPSHFLCKYIDPTRREKLLSAKSKSFFQAFFLIWLAFSLDWQKIHTARRIASLPLLKAKAFYMHVSHFLCNYKESTRREELRCSLLKYKFFPSLIRGHKFKDSTQREDGFFSLLHSRN